VSPLAGFTGTVLGPAGKCLDVANARAVQGAIVQIVTCNGSSAQLWTGASDDTLQALGLCLTSTVADSNRALLYTCDGSAAQKWTVTSSSLMNLHSRLCLDTVGSSTDDRTELVTRGCGDGTGQSWVLQG
jgi:hypothetical protein